MFLAVLLLAGFSGLFSEEKVEARGYYKNFSILLMLPAYNQNGFFFHEPDLGAVQNRLRLDLKFRLSSRVTLHSAYDILPKVQDRRLFEESVFTTGLTPLEYRITDFRERLYPGSEGTVSSFGLFHNLDRLYVAVRTDLADVSIGRQAIAWGSARVINPTDILAPFAFNELDKEERRGVDAVRIRVPLGMMDELDFGFVAGHRARSRTSAFFLRGKVHVEQTDWTGVLVAFRRHLLIGLDIARALGGAGFWAESALVIPQVFADPERPREKAYFRTSIGLDYSLSSTTYGFVEYHFSSAGKTRPESYSELLGSAASKDGSVYLFGKHYVSVGATYQISPLVPFMGLAIFNLSDRSLMLSPILEYNIAENIYLGGGAYIGLGKNPESLPTLLPGKVVLMHSEFGAYPDMVFTSFRLYF